MPPITVHVKTSTEGRLDITVADVATTTVAQFKELIATQCPSIPAAQQRLIYSGKVLKDEDVLAVYKLEDGHTVHLVKGGKPPGAATTPAPTAFSTTTTANAPTSAVGGGASAAAANPFASMLGGMGAGMGMGGGMPGMPAGGMNMMGPVLQMLASNPALMEQMLTNNPMLAQMGIDPAHMRQMMSDPMFLQMMSNPQLMEQAMQMQGAMGGMGGMGAFGGMGGGMPGATPSATSPGAQQARSPPMMNPLLQQMMMGGMPGMGGAPAAPAVPQDPPEVRFQVQLQQMQEMGFYDAAANIRALLACGGNVQAALEFMFSQ